jgi:hypothetical protein
VTTTAITSIKRGIVFLMATWSGAAQWALPKLVAFIEQHHISSEQLHLLNADAHPELYDLPELNGKTHGWGEAFVVKGGRIVFFTCLGKDKNLVHMRCEELLQAYAN